MDNYTNKVYFHLNYMSFFIISLEGLKKKKNHSIQYTDSSPNLHLTKIIMYNHTCQQKAKNANKEQQD